MSSSEIAKLESRWRENPQGLTFAPLAEAYRKMREIPRALEILADGLGRHPDYIPASIVLGRCQLDLGDDAQAESAFAHVLELDDENVIALKALSEIAERQGRFNVAQARLMTLLSVDRSNDEARIQLARIEELRVAAEAAPDEAADSDVPQDLEAVAGMDTDTAERQAEEISGTFGRVPAEEGSFQPEAEAGDGPASAEAGIELEDNLQLDEDVEQLPDLVVDDLPEIASEVADAQAMDGLVGQDFREHGAQVAPLEDLAPGTASLGSAEPDHASESTDPEASIPVSDSLPSGGFEASTSASESDVSAESDGLTESESETGAASESLAADDPFADRDSLEEPETMGEIQLEPSPSNEFQLSSASDDWAESIGPGGGAEYQLPSAADELAAELSAVEEEVTDDIPGAQDASTSEEPGLREFGEEPALGAGGQAITGDEPDALASVDELESAVAEANDADAAEPEAAEATVTPEATAVPEAAAQSESPTDFAPAAPREHRPLGGADTPREPQPAAVTEDDDGYPDPLEDSGDLADADLIVTESMAELFLRQGHRGEALRVYRQLYQRSRDDLRLREKVDSLETELAEEEVAPPSRAPYEAPDTSRSVAAFLSGILDARPADAPAAWGSGAGAPQPVDPAATAAEPGEAAPTRPASDHLSLSAVFGEDGSPVPPASPSASTPSEEGISFDAFFGGDESGGAPRTRAAAREDDDLDQFQNWLQNLKR